jgi:hypothetical protein
MSLAGKSICFTGTLSMKRAEAEKLATDAGATVKSGVSAALNILVAGSDAGSKIADASKKGVEVWTETQFQAALAGGPAASGRKSKSAAQADDEPAAKKGKSDAAPPAAKGKGKAKAEPPPDEPPAAKGKGKAKAEPPPDEPPAKKGKGKAEAPPAAATAAAKPSSVCIPVEKGLAESGKLPGHVEVHEDYAFLGNQVNIEGANNNNKFYRGQVVKQGGQFYCWTRWASDGL